MRRLLLVVRIAFEVLLVFVLVDIAASVPKNALPWQAAVIRLGALLLVLLAGWDAFRVGRRLKTTEGP